MQPEVASALTEAANLLLVGMVVVFLFLSMLIGAVSAIAWLNKVVPDPSAVASADKQSFVNHGSPSNQGVPPKVVAAISAAIRQHRRSN